MPMAHTWEATLFRACSKGSPEKEKHILGVLLYWHVPKYVFVGYLISQVRILNLFYFGRQGSGLRLSFIPSFGGSFGQVEAEETG